MGVDILMDPTNMSETTSGLQGGERGRVINKLK